MCEYSTLHTNQAELQLFRLFRVPHGCQNFPTRLDNWHPTIRCMLLISLTTVPLGHLTMRCICATPWWNERIKIMHASTMSCISMLEACITTETSDLYEQSSCLSCTVTYMSTWVILVVIFATNVSTLGSASSLKGRPTGGWCSGRFSWQETEENIVMRRVHYRVAGCANAVSFCNYETY